jgi:Ras-related GTP-binding protein A/B
VHYAPSSNNPASLTTRFGATIDVEQNHVRFLGDLVLNLWDCGGQDSFMDNYLSTQRSTIFQHVAVMIYVFDVESREALKDLDYYRDCIDGLRKYSSEANVFLLVHKMDLVREDPEDVFSKKKEQLEQESAGLSVIVFGTSIYNESLYRVRCFIFIFQLLILNLYSPGLVPYRSQLNPKRQHLVKTPLNPRGGM